MQGEGDVCEDFGAEFIGNLYNSTMLFTCQEECTQDCNQVTYTYNVKISDINEGELNNLAFTDKW